jgi:hypothetical protein
MNFAGEGRSSVTVLREEKSKKKTMTASAYKGEEANLSLLVPSRTRPGGWPRARARESMAKPRRTPATVRERREGEEIEHVIYCSTNSTSFFHFYFSKITHNFICKLQKLATRKLFQITRATTLLLGSSPNSKYF